MKAKTAENSNNHPALFGDGFFFFLSFATNQAVFLAGRGRDVLMVDAQTTRIPCCHRGATSLELESVPEERSVGLSSPADRTIQPGKGSMTTT